MMTQITTRHVAQNRLIRRDAEKPSVRRVAVYCRVSTEQELQEGSFELQMSYYRELVMKRPDMILVDVYGDRGKSGRNMRRPDFQRMLKDCEAGLVDMVIAKSISRFARNVIDCVATIRRLKELGIEVFFEREGIHTMDGQSELLLNVMASLAQEESNSISRNILWANEQHNSSGKPMFKPSYGYTKARRDWQWHVQEQEAKRVRCAFEKAAAGMCYKSICETLNAMEREEQTGIVWKQHRLRYLLSNVSYIGDCVTGKTVTQGNGKKTRVNDGSDARHPKYWIEEHHEPLVSRETFDAVQEMIRSGALNSRDMTRLHQANASRRGDGRQQRKEQRNGTNG